jgi:hypothetical protein
MFEMTTELPLWKRPGDVMMGVWNETLNLGKRAGKYGNIPNFKKVRWILVRRGTA